MGSIIDDLEYLAKGENVEYIGFQRVFRKAYEEKCVPLHWAHWNYEGHKVVANALVGKLKSIIKPHN